MPNLYDLTDDDGDQVFEVTMDLSPGEFNYHLLRDNGWSWDSENPDYPNGIPSNGSIMHVSDPMISYLLPKNGDFYGKIVFGPSLLLRHKIDQS